MCDSETEANWAYFFNHMKNILDKQARLVTFVSDRGAGLLSAFDNVFPANPHLYCYYHLKNNLKSRITGKGSHAKSEEVVDCFFKCAYSSTEKEYYQNLVELRTLGGPELIDGFLKDLPVQNWCRAFALGCRFGIMANTIAESFNSWIDVERGMPVYSMFESVRMKQMEMGNDRREDADTWYTTLTPELEKALDEQIKLSRSYKVIKAHRGLYEVRDKFSYEVDLNEFTCSCVKWQINSFPCHHACSAILSSGLDIYQFIHPVHTVAEFRKAYAIPIKPVSNVDEMFFNNNNAFILPPNVKTPAGRPKKRRFKSAAEGGYKKQITCGRCKAKGTHNRSTCRAAI